MTIDQKKRMSAKQALDHPWLQADLKTHPSGEGKDLLPNMRANFDARRTLRKAIWSVRWANAVQKDSHANAEEKVRTPRSSWLNERRRSATRPRTTSAMRTRCAELWQS